MTARKSAFRRHTTLSVIALMSLSVVFLGIGAIFCRFTLHVPRRVKPKPEGATPVQIAATKDGALLKAW